MRASAFIVAVLAVGSLVASVATAEPPSQPPTPSESKVERVVGRARQEVTSAVRYDASWFSIGYPGGDLDPSVGVCTDVVIRAYRTVGVDFQQLVHEDVLRAPQAYAPFVVTPDKTIDHRRVGPLMRYLGRHARSLPLNENATYEAGDIVVISFHACPACGPAHIALVSDKRGPRGLPLLLHNVGPVASEDDVLDAWTRIGHYRLLEDASNSAR